ncbi:septation protein A [Neisseriaceae bacterium ESL0693]|nr:septation protein A [Neisseriaceae bacterium ESL0693]
MKAAFEFLVVILFFITYALTKDIILATKVAIVCGVLQAAWCLIKYRKLQLMQTVSLLLVVILGGATIYLKNPHFIMWKPTLLFWVMALGLLIGQLVNKNLLKITMGKEIQLPEPIWRRLTCAWVLFFVFLGGLNLWVAYSFTEDQWVSYKLFGTTTLLIIFIIAQTLYISRYFKKDET